MASQGEGSQKWKRKRMLEARAERMREAKQARLQETRESSDRDDQQTCGSNSGDQASSRPRDAPEPDDDGPQQSESENDRDSESLSSESDFDDEKAQSIFNDWMVSKPTSFESENSGCPFAASVTFIL